MPLLHLSLSLLGLSYLHLPYEYNISRISLGGELRAAIVPRPGRFPQAPGEKREQGESESHTSARKGTRARVCRSDCDMARARKSSLRARKSLRALSLLLSPGLPGALHYYRERRAGNPYVCGKRIPGARAAPREPIYFFFFFFSSGARSTHRAPFFASFTQLNRPSRKFIGGIIFMPRF